MESDLYQVIYASAETRPVDEDELLGMLKYARGEKYTSWNHRDVTPL